MPGCGTTAKRSLRANAYWQYKALTYLINSRADHDIVWLTSNTIHIARSRHWTWAHPNNIVTISQWWVEILRTSWPKTQNTNVRTVVIPWFRTGSPRMSSSNGPIVSSRGRQRSYLGQISNRKTRQSSSWLLESVFVNKSLRTGHALYPWTGDSNK